MRKKFSVALVTVAMLSIATPVFAESAPVYDADSIQDQFDTAAGSPNDVGADVPPPAPGQEANAFVPAPSSASVGASAVTVVPPIPTTGKTTLEKRVKRLEQQLGSSQGGENVAKVDSLQEQVQSLRGQVEQLTHQLQQLQDQQKSLYADMDKRILAVTPKAGKKPLAPGMTVDGDTTSVADNTATATDTTVAVAKGSSKVTPSKATSKSSTTAIAAAAAAAVSTPPTSEDTKPTGDQPNVAEEQQIYQTAYNLIKSKKYNQAVNSLQDMLKKYPSGQFASNAHYWLGELYGLMNKNDNALTEFTTVVSKYPESPRVSDAQLKIGLIYAAESNWSEAKTSFKKVVNHYPGTASARVASEQLKAIKQAGN